MGVNIAVPLLDLKRQYTELKPELDAAVARVLDSGWYILGEEVDAFEREFAIYLDQLNKDEGAQHSDSQPPLQCVGVNSGTDALEIALRACAIGPGDEVITVAHTAVATASAISQTGATPVFVDVDPTTYTMLPEAFAQAITPQTKAVIPVHLYGHPAPMLQILAHAREKALYVIEDCAQAHGARYRGQSVGNIGDLGCFSFYPTKNLGALGDGGAVVGRNPELMERARLLREYGWTPQSRYISQIQGGNSRLDEMQAAILRVKLGYLTQWNGIRRALASVYTRLLPRNCLRPVEEEGCEHVYHLYVVRVRNRDDLCSRLRAQQIGTGIHYPVPIHRQPAYTGHTSDPRSTSSRPATLPNTERLVQEIVSLPMHPYLQESEIERVATAMEAAIDGFPSGDCTA